MADRKSLVIVSGATSQIPNADTLVVGAGVTTAAGSLTINSFTGSVVLAANAAVTAAAGTGSFDVSGGSGVFKTTTGAVTIGPGAVGVSGVSTFSAAGTALTVTNNALVSGTLTVAGFRLSTTPTNGYVLTSDATGIGTWQAAGAASSVTIGTTTATSGTVGSVLFVGTGPVLQQDNANFFWDDTNNRLGLGNATPAQTLDVTGIAQVSGAIYANGGVDRSAAAALNIGTTNATSISVGAIGVTTFILGNLSVAGTVNTIGGTTFSTDSTFLGNVTFGDAVTDTVKFISSIGPTGDPDFHFVKELNHVIDVNASTTAATAGGILTIRSGAGNGAAGGALVVDTGTGTVGGAITLGTTNAASVGIGRSGITTTVTGGLTQLTGAVSLTGNGASSFTTSAGALTLTSAVAATWGTTAGALTLNGVGGIGLQGNGTTALVVNAAGTAITVQAGATLATTGTGNINLPNNGSARFQIETVTVSANVTSANLGTLTAGSTSDASALHTHVGIAAGGVTMSVTTGEAIDAGEVVVIRDDTVTPGTAKAYKADSDDNAKNFGTLGLAATSVGSGAALAVYTAGERSVVDGEFDVFPATTDVGKPVYMSATAGNMTVTAPTTGFLQKIGIVSQGGTGAVKVAIQIHDRVEL